MKSLRNLFIFTMIPAFILILIIGASAGASQEMSKPIDIVASDKKITDYAEKCAEIGAPWDIVILTDTIIAQNNKLKSLDDINPCFTALQFMKLEVKVEHYEVVESGVDDKGKVWTKSDWVYYKTDTYIAKNEILSFIGNISDGDTSITPSDISAKTNEKTDNLSNEEYRYSATYITNTDFQGVLSTYIQLEEGEIDNIIQLYKSNYLNSWLPEDLKQKVNQINDKFGLTQLNKPSSNISYDGVEFKDGEVAVKYYNQADPRWASNPYAGENIGYAGCGPTSLAMAVSTLTGNSYDPAFMCKWAADNNYSVNFQGSLHSVIPDGARHFGLKVEGCKHNETQRLVDALSSGKLVIVLMGRGTFTTGGHFMLLRGITKNKKVLIADPASFNRSKKKWALSLIQSESKHAAGAGGPFWIIYK